MSTHPYTRLFVLPAPPDADDDVTLGYEVGDVWHHTGGSVYDCRDATNGAAVWEERTGGGSFDGDVTGQFKLSGDISVALTGDVDDWNPTGLATASVIRITCGEADGITGIVATDGKVLVLINVDTTADDYFIVYNEDANSVAANRLSIGESRNIYPGQGIVLWYDNTSSRWRKTSHDLSPIDVIALIQQEVNVEFLRDAIGLFISSSTHIGLTATYDDPGSQLNLKVIGDGWMPHTGAVPTRTAADDPTYTIQFGGQDMTTLLSEGSPIKWTQNGIVRYGWITTISYSFPNTNCTVLTRCNDASSNYDVLDTASFAITNFYFSPPKQPGIGFPVIPDIWTISVVSTSDVNQSSPAALTFYQVVNVAVAIGSWKIRAHALINILLTLGAATAVGIQMAVSNSSGAVSHNTLRSFSRSTLPAVTGGQYGATLDVLEESFVLAAKTTMYMLMAVSGAYTTLSAQGATVTTEMRFVCAYL